MNNFPSLFIQGQFQDSISKYLLCCVPVGYSDQRALANHLLPSMSIIPSSFPLLNRLAPAYAVFMAISSVRFRLGLHSIDKENDRFQCHF